MFEHTETHHEYEMRANIFEATNDLLRAYSYHELSVKNICRVADISKPTFYRYFADKHAIAQWALLNYMRQPHQVMIHSSTCEETLSAITNHVFRYKDFYRKCFISSETEALLNLITWQITDNFEEILYRQLHVIQSETLDFQIKFTASACPSMLIQWLVQDMPYSPEMLAQYLTAIIPYQLRELFDSFALAQRH